VVTSAWCGLLLGLASARNHGNGVVGYMTCQEKMTFRWFSCISLFIGISWFAPIVQMSNIWISLQRGFCKALDRTEEIMNFSARRPMIQKRTCNPRFQRGFVFWRGVICLRRRLKEVIKGVSFFLLQQVSVDAWWGTSGLGKTTIAGLAATFFKSWFSGKIP